MIETGRFQKIHKEQRFCPFCVNSVESEIHFLTQCPTYHSLRAKAIQQVEQKRAGFRYYTDTQKFQYLLSDECLEITPKLIYNCMKVRDTLLTPH